MASGVQYSQLAQKESESALFDYSSAFSYASTDPNNYASIFKYKTALKSSEYDLQRDRGLSNKSLAERLIYWSAITFFIFFIILTFPISAWFVIKRVKNEEQLVVSRLGIIKCVKGPTVVMVIPYVDQTTSYSTSLREFNIPPQKVTTSDGLLVELGAIIRYQIIDAEKTCFAAQDIYHTMRVTAQTMTSKYIHGVKEKQLTDTGSIHNINAELKTELQKTFLAWGIAINTFELTGLKAIMRVEEQDALTHVIEPLKQWFFGGQEGAGAIPDALAGSPMAGMTKLLSGAMASAKVAPVSTDLPKDASTQPATLASLSHTLTPSDLLRAVKTVSNRRLVEQVNTIYKFIISEDDPGIYYLDLKNGEGDCGLGEPPLGRADTTITISLANMQAMFTGTLQPFDAYMSGALHISGDTAGAMKLDGLVKSIADVASLT